MQALTADTCFLAQRGSGRVEQVFSRAVNLWLPTPQRLMTLLSEASDNAPNSSRLALTHFDGLFRPGEPVQFHPDGITIGSNIKIDTTASQCWRPPKLTLSAKQFRNIPWQQWRDVIYQQLQDDETLFLWRGDNPFYRAISAELQQRRKILFQALRDDKNIISAVANMIGLGVGLTPSSDDYLVGLSAILLIDGHPAEKYREAFLTALDINRKNTTQLSAVTLDAAFEKRYRENIIGFIASMVNEPFQLSVQKIACIKNIGSSSGCDMLIGMADACALSQTYGGNYVCQNSH